MAKKGIIEWAKDLKHNEKVAEKFIGVKTVADILSVAKANGYEFTENELMDFDLDSVAGGTNSNNAQKSNRGFSSEDIRVSVLTQIANASASALGANSTIQANPVYNFNARNDS